MIQRATLRDSAPCSTRHRLWLCAIGLQGLSLLIFLTGCRSTQEVYLAQATNHATVREVEQAFGQPTYDQTFASGYRRWLYRREGGGTGNREFTPYCQDLWLTFDGEGILRDWQMQRC